MAAKDRAHIHGAGGVVRTTFRFAAVWQCIADVQEDGESSMEYDFCAWQTCIRICACGFYRLVP